jgi:hypothetical protein
MGKLNIMALWIHSYFKVLPLKQGFEVEPLSAVKCPPGDLVRGYKYEKKLGRANRSCISAKPVPEDIGFSAQEAPYYPPPWAKGYSRPFPGYLTRDLSNRKRWNSEAPLPKVFLNLL